MVDLSSGPSCILCTDGPVSSSIAFCCCRNCTCAFLRKLPPASLTTCLGLYASSTRTPHCSNYCNIKSNGVLHHCFLHLMVHPYSPHEGFVMLVKSYIINKAAPPHAAALSICLQGCGSTSAVDPTCRVALHQCVQQLDLFQMEVCTLSVTSSAPHLHSHQVHRPLDSKVGGKRVTSCKPF